MKVKIEKLSHGAIKIEVAPDTKTKPLVITLDRDQLDGLLSVINVVWQSDTLKFDLEL